MKYKDCVNKECRLYGDCLLFNQHPENCYKYKTEVYESDKKTILNNNITTCHRYLDFIEEVLDDYDEEIGLTYNNVDYETAICELRHILNYIKENRWYIWRRM